MIKEVVGDILLSGSDLIAHGVAPNDNFGQGLALSLRDRWPALYKDFRHYCQTTHPEPGQVWVWTGADRVRIANLLTQEAAYGHGAKPGIAHLDYVNHALRELRKVIEKEKIKSIAITKIATGVGRLDWDDVKPLIAKHLGDMGIPVYVYATFKPDVKAQEN
ncbi:macro domain-containing protein [bacterium]|nr:macro domain-containing protein [bacterium]